MTPAVAPAHLLVIDRDARLRDLLRQYLKSQGFLVSLARDGDHASRLLAGLEFDLVLLDAGLPGAESLRGELRTPVLCLADKLSPASGNAVRIAKPFEPKALCERINAMLDRRPPAATPAPSVIRMGALAFYADAARLTRDDVPVRLTATEAQLMRIFAANAGQPLGRGELVAGLGREGLHAKARAIDVQITRLRRKIEEDPKNPRFLQTVRGAGYLLALD